MSESIQQTLTEEVIRILQQHPDGITAAEVYDQSELAADRKSVSNALYGLKQKGQVMSSGRHRDVRYYLVEDSEPTAEPPQAQPPADDDPDAERLLHRLEQQQAAEPADAEPIDTSGLDATREALRTAHREAVKELYRYVMGLKDRGLYARLRAVDAASDAVEQIDSL